MTAFGLEHARYYHTHTEFGRWAGCEVGRRAQSNPIHARTPPPCSLQCILYRFSKHPCNPLPNPQVIKAGATTLNIPDTTGWCLPHEFGELIAAIKKNTPGADNVIISTHCQVRAEAGGGAEGAGGGGRGGMWPSPAGTACVLCVWRCGGVGCGSAHLRLAPPSGLTPAAGVLQPVPHAPSTPPFLCTPVRVRPRPAAFVTPPSSLLPPCPSLLSSSPSSLLSPCPPPQNDLGLSTANSLAGAQAGARQIECTINGIGERAGNASLEEVVMAIKLRG